MPTYVHAPRPRSASRGRSLSRGRSAKGSANIPYMGASAIAFTDVWKAHGNAKAKNIDELNAHADEIKKYFDSNKKFDRKTKKQTEEALTDTDKVPIGFIYKGKPKERADFIRAYNKHKSADQPAVNQKADKGKTSENRAWTRVNAVWKTEDYSVHTAWKTAKWQDLIKGEMLLEKDKMDRLTALIGELYNCPVGHDGDIKTAVRMFNGTPTFAEHSLAIQMMAQLSKTIVPNAEEDKDDKTRDAHLVFADDEDWGFGYLASTMFNEPNELGALERYYIWSSAPSNRTVFEPRDRENNWQFKEIPEDKKINIGRFTDEDKAKAFEHDYVYNGHKELDQFIRFATNVKSVKPPRVIVGMAPSDVKGFQQKIQALANAYKKHHGRFTFVVRKKITLSRDFAAYSPLLSDDKKTIKENNVICVNGTQTRYLYFIRTFAHAKDMVQAKSEFNEWVNGVDWRCMIEQLKKRYRDKPEMNITTRDVLAFFTNYYAFSNHSDKNKQSWEVAHITDEKAIVKLSNGDIQNALKLMKSQNPDPAEVKKEKAEEKKSRQKKKKKDVEMSAFTSALRKAQKEAAATASLEAVAAHNPEKNATLQQDASKAIVTAGNSATATTEKKKKKRGTRGRSLSRGKKGEFKSKK